MGLSNEDVEETNTGDRKTEETQEVNY